MVWRRRKVERVRLGIIADNNFEIYGPQLRSGVLWFGMQNLWSANMEIAVRNWALDSEIKNTKFTIRKRRFFFFKD
jgi:hypothetical protein